MKKALILASVASMIDQFNMQNIQLLQNEGYHVDVIANFEQGNTISQERIVELKNRLAEKNVDVYHIPIPRKIFDIKGIWNSLVEVRKKCNDNKYDLVHCHSPIGGVIARLGAKKARKKGTKVIYTAHGFHFYKGAPKKNWLIFYPIEKICAHWTDVLITINKEDYTFAQKKMKAGSIEYIPGIGVDTDKFNLKDFDKESKKEELGFPNDAIVLLSVGELNKNKNHEIIIKALSNLNNQSIHYVVAGRGDLGNHLTKLADDLGVSLHLLGYRTDIPELYNMADIFVFPSFREGLSVSLMEAMATSLPCVVSRIRGNVDLIQNNKNGYLCKPNDVDSFAEAIAMLAANKQLREEMGKNNREVIREFDLHKVCNIMKKIYF